MVARCLFVVAVCGASASMASATVTEVSALIFRQTSARARNGPAASPVVVTDTNSSAVMGAFVETRSAISASGMQTAHSNQNSNIANAFYTGTLHADASAAADQTGNFSDASSNYGSGPSFQSVFSIAWTVDAFTTGHIFGSVSATKTGQSTTSPALFLIGDILLPGTPQPALLNIQPSQAGSPANFDGYFNFLPGHRYSISASIALTAGGQFTSGGSGSGDINFTADIPAPATAGLLTLAGLGAMRRRR